MAVFLIACTRQAARMTLHDSERSSISVAQKQSRPLITDRPGCEYPAERPVYKVAIIAPRDEPCASQSHTLRHSTQLVTLNADGDYRWMA